VLSFGRSAVADLLNITAGWLELGDDPLLVYSLAAAALLAFVSLVSAVGRLDFAALLRPRALVALCCAVLLAFAGVALAELALTDPELEGLALGAARFPLYVVALAFGPTVGLAAGALFAAATAVGPFPGWSEAILCLELLVLGWLAIYPSPRAVRWAGPLDALLAHVFTAGTAGVAFLVLPRHVFSGGMDMMSTSDADYTRWDHIRPFLPGALGFLSGSVLADLPTPSVVWPFYFVSVTGVILWSFAAEGRRAAAVGRRRARRALEQTSLEDATTTRLDAADAHRELLKGLAELGAVDGIRARMWRLAGYLDREVPGVHEEVRALQQVGVVGLSTVDAGADISRHLVEITPVGVRVLEELRNR